MLGMRLGGVDPSILRELSGVYKPFTKAVKELISNAYDADADTVTISCADDFSSLTVTDDGTGMTPFEFRNDFTRIGGGSRRWTGDKTRKGRLRIGSKGIGFLALARYCSQLRVRSSANRVFRLAVPVSRTPSTIDVRAALGIPLCSDILARRLELDVVRQDSHGERCRSRQYRWDPARGRLSVAKNIGPVVVRLSVNCKGLAFEAVLDFDRLLQLADRADLDKIDDFASIEVRELDRAGCRGTTIAAEQLKPFVRRELRADRRKGFVRNIGSVGGLEQFRWYLSRCTPVPYTPRPETQDPLLSKLLEASDQPLLRRLEVRHANSVAELRRPVYPFEPGVPCVPRDMLIKVNIAESGLRATGFVAAFERVVFPAEYRGLAIRVRGVQIGDAHFLGAEHLLTGASKAALSQISGEINVLSGLDTADTLNPGRESFYEESEHFKILRRHLIGEGEHIGGHLWRAVTAVLRRSQVTSALADTLGRASIRRRALEDVSAAVAHLVGRDDAISDALRGMLRSKASDVNGLSDSKAFHVGAPDRVGGLPVVFADHLTQPADVDYVAQEIRLDKRRPEWNWDILLFDRKFEVIHKWGRPDQPLAEADLRDAKIYVNWAHPIKSQMDERSFLRFALAWVLAKATACDDSRVMMDLALRLLSFTTSGHD